MIGRRWSFDYLPVKSVLFKRGLNKMLIPLLERLEVFCNWFKKKKKWWNIYAYISIDIGKLQKWAGQHPQYHHCWIWLQSVLPTAPIRDADCLIGVKLFLFLFFFNNCGCWTQANIWSSDRQQSGIVLCSLALRKNSSEGRMWVQRKN